MLGEPLNAAAQAVTLSGGNIEFSGAALDGHKTFADAGAEDGKEYHIELRGSEGWELLRIEYTDGTPATAVRPSPLRSSNDNNSVAFAGAVEAVYALPGVLSELAELLDATEGNETHDILHRAGQIGSIDGDVITMDGATLGGHVGMTAAGMIGSAGAAYILLVEQGDTWSLWRARALNNESPLLLQRSVELDTSAGGDPVSFDSEAPVEVKCVIPGIKAELQALFA